MIGFELFLKNFGQNVVRLRKAMMLTQKDVAQKVGITYRYFQKIEVGRANVTLLTLFRLAQFFNVSMADLIASPTE